MVSLTLVLNISAMRCLASSMSVVAECRSSMINPTLRWPFLKLNEGQVGGANVA